MFIFIIKTVLASFFERVNILYRKNNYCFAPRRPILYYIASENNGEGKPRTFLGQLKQIEKEKGRAKFYLPAIRRTLFYYNYEFASKEWDENQFNMVMESLGLKADAHMLTKTYGKSVRDKMKLFCSISPEEHDQKTKLEILFSKDLSEEQILVLLREWKKCNKD